MTGADRPLFPETGSQAAPMSAWRRTRFIALAAAAVLPPIALAGLPGALATLGALHMAAAGMGLLIIAPTAAAFAAEFKGRDALFGIAALPIAAEFRFALLRLSATGGILAYALGLTVFSPESGGVGPCLVIAILAVVTGWLFLLDLICRPRALRIRRYVAMISDIGLLSAFLHAGGGITAAWYPAYLGIAFAHGLDLDFGAFLLASLTSAAGFSLVVATTPVWRQQGILSGGLVLALLLLPAEFFLLMRGQAARANSRDERLPRAAGAEDGCDLAGRRVLIASADAEFARGLAAQLRAWRGDVWIVSLSERAVGEALDDLGAPPILIIDGRDEMLAALSLAYRIATTGESGGLPVLFVAEAAAAEGLATVGGGFLAGILANPIAVPLLAGALRAVPPPPPPPASRPRLRPTPPVFADRRGRDPEPETGMPQPAAGPAPTVTSITAHPRFAADASPVIDEAVVEALEGLGSGRDFLGGLIEVFRGDAQEILEALGAAVSAADPARFRESLHALKGCAANVGGVRLCELLQSIRDMTASELRSEGGALVQRISAEAARLAAALREHLDRDAAQGG